MRNLLFYTNCVGQGLDKFLRLNPCYLEKFNPTVVYNYMVDLGQSDLNVFDRAAREADVFIFHRLDTSRSKHSITINDLLPKLKPDVWMIPMSVPYNSGYFIWHHDWSPELKAAVIQTVRTAGMVAARKFYLTEGDLEWVKRWNSCLARMKQKEEEEGVPSDIRCSDIIDAYGRNCRMFQVPNHPSSCLFWPWSLRLAEFLGLPLQGGEATQEFDPNYAGLPCEDVVCESARKHLRLHFPADADAKLEVAMTNELTQAMA